MLWFAVAWDAHVSGGGEEQMGNATEYNYPRFDEYVTSGREAEEFGAFATHLGVGESAPDAALTRLDDGEAITLSDLWRSEPLVIEFGSFT